MAKYVIKDGNLYNVDELYHAKFKYIKREWIKGKWRYWYEDSKIKKTATKVTNKAKDKLGYDEKQKVTDAKKKVDAAKKTVETTKKQLDVIKSNTAEDKRAQKTMVKNATAKVETATKEVDKANKVVDKAIEEYSKTPLAKIENLKKKVDAGKETLKKDISNLINGKSSMFTVLTEEEKKAHNEQAAKDKAVKEREETFAKLDREGKLRETPSYQPIEDFDDLVRKSSTTSREEDMAAVNPSGNRMNCSYCTFAYEMRRRGYDVMAADDGYPKTLMYANRMEEYYVDGDGKTVGTSDIISSYNKRHAAKKSSSTLTTKMIEEELLQHGEGARGQIGVGWKAGSGHALNWEIENNKVVIRDSQVNTVGSIDDYIDRIDSFYYLRTDNLELKPEALKFVKRGK